MYDITQYNISIVSYHGGEEITWAGQATGAELVPEYDSGYPILEITTTKGSGYEPLYEVYPEDLQVGGQAEGDFIEEWASQHEGRVILCTH